MLSCSSSKPGNCEKNGCGYRIRCEICMRAGRLSLYDGESGSPCYTRGKQHQDGLWLKDEEIPLWEHCLVEYVGNRAQFPMEQTGVFGICLVNQVHEAVRIEMSTADCAIKVRVPSSSIGESCASEWVGGGAGSRSRSTTGRRWRQRWWRQRKRRAGTWKLVNAMTFFTVFDFHFSLMFLLPLTAAGQWMPDDEPSWFESLANSKQN